MKCKKIYTIILLLITSLVLSWAIPGLVRTATTTGQTYPFAYYSSILQDFAIAQQDGSKKISYIDRKGNKYTKQQFDSITPLFSYRQLNVSGNMPDSVLGVPVDAKLLNSKSLVWKYSPREKNKSNIGLYIMFESMSGRVNLEMPDDVFRLKDDIEFIVMEDGKEDKEKSAQFRQALEKVKFDFPAIEVWGNLSPKKPYDEGYFVLDNNHQLFHLKMVNGKAFVRNTKIGDEIDIAYFSIKEVTDKSIYGFVIDKDGFLYTLGEGYKLTKFDIPPIDIEKHSIMLMGNLFYWMVNVTTTEGCSYYVLDAATLKQHDKPYFVEASVNKWDTVSAWTFPVYIDLASKYTTYIKPMFIFNGGYAFLFSGLLAVLYISLIGRKKEKYRCIMDTLLILIFGVPALIASLIVKSSNK